MCVVYKYKYTPIYILHNLRYPGTTIEFSQSYHMIIKIQTMLRYFAMSVFKLLHFMN